MGVHPPIRIQPNDHRRCVLEASFELRPYLARGIRRHILESLNGRIDLIIMFRSGKALPQACKEAEIVEQTYYRWRKEYGGLKVDQARR
jgi:hypothetical protein